MDPSTELDYLETLLPLVGIIFLIAVGVVFMNQQFQKSLFKQQLAREELKNKHQLEMLQTTIQVQEDERKRIAQDLHDELGAALSISKMHLLRLEKLGQTEPEAALREFPELRKYVDSALTSTRRISHQLMPARLQTMGLEKSLVAMAEQASAAGVVQFEVDINDQLTILPWAASLSLYRIYGELINNTLRHARATHSQLKIELNQARLLFFYTDNGQGLRLEKEREGIGLKGMEGRVSALRGKLTFGNREEGGFFARIELPLA
ncbi:MAG: sensor histidine kinase [Bacteroidia bacterium]|nr:sensor histidine kinase [Bacteroidia bacterium]